MSEQTTEKVPHKDGPPWENVRVFASFGEADALRKSLLQDASKQAKVKVQTSSQGESIFVVKTRTNPALVEQEDKPKKNKKTK